MNCRDNENLLLAERDGVLDSEQRAALARHVAACPACRQLQTRLTEALDGFRADAASVAVPDANEAWQDLRAELRGGVAKPSKKRPLAPIIWFSTPLAAAAALTLAYIGFRPESAEPVAPAVTHIPADATIPADANASVSTMAYVDKESGWLVVWAADGEAKIKG